MTSRTCRTDASTRFCASRRRSPTAGAASVGKLRAHQVETQVEGGEVLPDAVVQLSVDVAALGFLHVDEPPRQLLQPRERTLQFLFRAPALPQHDRRKQRHERRDGQGGLHYEYVVAGSDLRGREARVELSGEECDRQCQQQIGGRCSARAKAQPGPQQGQQHARPCPAP